MARSSCIVYGSRTVVQYHAQKSPLPRDMKFSFTLHFLTNELSSQRADSGNWCGRIVSTRKPRSLSLIFCPVHSQVIPRLWLPPSATAVTDGCLNTHAGVRVFTGTLYVTLRDQRTMSCSEKCYSVREPNTKFLKCSNLILDFCRTFCGPGQVSSLSDFILFD